ncbi:MAG: magnesium chelatase subunit D [Hyphomicrobiaceae bacterium]
MSGEAAAPVEAAGADIKADIGADDPWGEARRVAMLMAVDPVGLAGAVVRCRPGEATAAWLGVLSKFMPPVASVRYVPRHIDDERLLGGLDLAATLAAGRPCFSRGLLAEADGGIVVFTGAERMERGLAARIACVIDKGQVEAAAGAAGGGWASRFLTIAIDEHDDSDDDRVPIALSDRVAFVVQLGRVRGMPGGDDVADEADRSRVEAARRGLAHVTIGDEHLARLCGAALILGVESLRAPFFAARAAIAAAALDGRAEVASEDIELAARWVLAPRVTRIPEPSSNEQQPTAEPPPEPQSPSDSEGDGEPQDKGQLDDLMIAAVMASLPKGLLDAAAAHAAAVRKAAPVQGRVGAVQRTKHRGRPVGARRGQPRGGARIALLATLRAAAPWQTLRKGARHAGGTGSTPGARRIEVRAEDLHIKRFKAHTPTCTVFLVDASGSNALNRLAEAKGAVELLLAECYTRRDRVALVAFRGQRAEVLLPPTHALARAKRSLAHLPGGGGTPLASGLDAGLALAVDLQRRGERPTLVLLTDGRANVSRDGRGGRAGATEQARHSAAQIRRAGIAAVLIDTSTQPRAEAEAIARDLGATYIPLPYASARGLADTILAATA